MNESKQARRHDELIAELLDSCVPKTEREHAAAREIERLRSAWKGWKAAMDAQAKVWIVVDDAGQPKFADGWLRACHEHINEALAMDFDEARAWHVREAVLLPLSSNREGNAPGKSKPKARRRA